MRGIDFALNDICLAVFTTLAPGAALCYVALACTLLFGGLGQRRRHRLESWLIVPLALATVGLVASATHLGTPSNALYVFRTVGSSPLATEVFCAVLFLGTACSYWLACIYLEAMVVLRRIWLAVSIVAALLFIGGTTLAYAMPTVITWDTALSKAGLPLSALACMAPLALLMLTCAGCAGKPRLVKTLVCLSLLATVAACAVMAVQYVELGGLSNAFGTAASLVPFYPATVALFGACLFAANIGALRAVQTPRATEKEQASRDKTGQQADEALGREPTSALQAPTAPVVPNPSLASQSEGFSPAERRALIKLCLLCLLAYCATFAVRFCFYCFHMTSGVV